MTTFYPYPSTPTIGPLDFEIKAGNLDPPLALVLVDSFGMRLPPLPLGTSARLHMQHRGILSLVLDAPMGFIQTSAGGLTYQDPTYHWEAGDTDVPGDYDVEVVVTYPSGRTQTFPSKGTFPVHITQQLPRSEF